MSGCHQISLCEFVSQGPHRGHLLVGTNRGDLYLFAVTLNKPPRNLGQISAAAPMHNSVTLILCKDGKVKHLQLNLLVLFTVISNGDSCIVINRNL